MRAIPLIDLLFEVNIFLQIVFFKLFYCEVMSSICKIVYIKLSTGTMCCQHICICSNIPGILIAVYCSGFQISQIKSYTRTLRITRSGFLRWLMAKIHLPIITLNGQLHIWLLLSYKFGFPVFRAAACLMFVASLVVFFRRKRCHGVG